MFLVKTGRRITRPIGVVLDNGADTDRRTPAPVVAFYRW